MSKLASIWQLHTDMGTLFVVAAADIKNSVGPIFESKNFGSESDLLSAKLFLISSKTKA